MGKKLFSLAMSKKNDIWMHETIQTKDDLKNWLECEKKAYSPKMSPFGGLFRLTEEDFIWRYQTRLRKTEYYLNSGKQIRYLVSRVRLIKMSAKFGINVRLNSCGKGLRIVHIFSVITSGDIGQNYTAFPNTLVGQGTRGGNPIIGDNVTAYTGAIIVGGITIANNITIGANSFVNKSFLEEGVTIVGNPASIVKK